MYRSVRDAEDLMEIDICSFMPEIYNPRQEGKKAGVANMRSSTKVKICREQNRKHDKKHWLLIISFMHGCNMLSFSAAIEWSLGFLVVPSRASHKVRPRAQCAITM